MVSTAGDRRVSCDRRRGTPQPGPTLRACALLSLSASIIAKWPHTLSYAKDVDHTRPHRREQPFTLDRVLASYLGRLDRSIMCLGMLHQLYRDLNIIENLRDSARVVYPHDARMTLPDVPDASQALVITSPPYFNASITRVLTGFPYVG